MLIYTSKIVSLGILALAIFAGTSYGQSSKGPLSRPGISAKTTLKAENIDPAVFRQAIDGKLSELSGKNIKASNVLWTDHPRLTVDWRGLTFGKEKKAGARHLQIGFKESIPVGSILTRGNISVSVLKDSGTAPGDPFVEEQWTIGQRLLDGKVTSVQVENRDDIALWVFPAGTSTRSLRFTHKAQASDATYEGWLAGALILRERLKNLAPQAQASSVSNNRHAIKITNGKTQTWRAWENMHPGSVEPADKNRPKVSAAHPENLLLVWPQPVSLDELLTVWVGFGSIEIQAYNGSKDLHPRDATDDAWKTVTTINNLECGYPCAFWPYSLPLGQTVTTRALRLRLTSPSPVHHPHMNGRTCEGRRVWLGEILATSALKDDPLTDVKLTSSMADSVHPPIPIPFKLEKPGYVTLVIEDEQGKRVRNLVSETWFPAGENIAWWDGTNDLDRDLDAAKHGLYRIPAKFVKPGAYTARGLTRDKITPIYEMTVYSEGNPPWSTPDHTGGWLANHSPPQAALAIPAAFSPTGEACVFLGCYITEGPDGFGIIDLDGRKLGGKKWIGGTWTAAPFLARDMSPKAATDTPAYVAAIGEAKGGKGLYELRITALKNGTDGKLGRDKEVCKLVVNPGASKLPNKWIAKKAEKERRRKVNTMAGIAAYGGRSVVSLSGKNLLLVIDNASGKLLEKISIADPRGLTCTAKGELLVLSGTKLIRYDFSTGKLGKQKPTTVIKTKLEDPVAIALDKVGNIYISDRGTSHQVKVFSSKGDFLRAIGKPGVPAAGPYDKLHMNNPAGLAIDSRNQLWVTEYDYLPRRVSVWSLDGTFIRATYGPAKYGGGGRFDSSNGDRFYYAAGKHGTMEFKIDLKSGTSELISVLYRNTDDSFEYPDRAGSPESVIVHNGKRYMSNCYNSSPVSGSGSAFIFQERGGVVHPIAGVGFANFWPLLKTEPFLANWPEGVDPQAGIWEDQAKHQCLFIWSDLNLDAQVQPEEVTIHQTMVIGVTVADDLSFLVARVGGTTHDKTGTASVRLRPVSVDGRGIPRYQYDKREVIVTDVYRQVSSGGGQLLADDSDEAIVTLGIEPFHEYSICGIKDGQPMWSYPNPWPGLHASHHSAKPDRPGQVIGATRLMGGFIQPKGSQVKPLWALNANMGNFYLFTRDGLFVATVFEDSRQGRRWNMATAVRGMTLDGITLADENFWPSISLTSEGEVMIVDGEHSSLVRLDGLDSLRPIDSLEVKVTAAYLIKSQNYVLEQEAARQKASGSGLLIARVGGKAPVVDGKIDDWNGATWVEIDKSGDGANFNSSAKPFHYQGALAVVGDTLYAAWDTRDGKLLRNSGESPNALFKTGGSLDIMLATDPNAPAKRKTAAKGDLRLLITKVGKETKATLYRQVVPGTPAEKKVPFSSPWRTITFDEVTDVSASVKLAADGKGGYEVAVPLSVLGFSPKVGMTSRGDIGLLRGNGSETTARIYWSNKATGITADVPSEAQLAPNLWGRINWKKSSRAEVKAQMPTPVGQLRPYFKSAKASSQEKGNNPENAADTNKSSRWAASNGTFPQWLEVELKETKRVKGVTFTFRNGTVIQYKVEILGKDGKWKTVVDKSKNKERVQTVKHSFDAELTKLKVTVIKAQQGWATITDLQLID